MVKKVKKYLKFVVCCALIMSLIAPSYAALSASDGSAFVTKAEFDSALADFNARLTTFEAGINSKIDSQVTSYLDRNGIWNGAEQDFWLWWEDPNYLDNYVNASGHSTWRNSYALWDSHLPDWSPAYFDGWSHVTPLIKNVSKSGLLFYSIPLVWFGSRNGNGYSPADVPVAFLQTSMDNLKRVYTEGPAACYAHIYSFGATNTTIRDPQDNQPYFYAKLYCGISTWDLVDLSVSKSKYTNVALPIQSKLLQYATQNHLHRTGVTQETFEAEPMLDYKWINMATTNLYSGYASPAGTGFVFDQRVHSTTLYSLQPPLTAAPWEWDATAEKAKWSAVNVGDVLMFSGNIFVTKGQPLLCQFGCSYIMYYINKSASMASGRVRESGMAAKLAVY